MEVDLIKYFEKTLEEELRKIYPDIKIDVHFPQIVAVIPSDSFVKDLKEKLTKDLEISKAIEVENIVWSYDGLRVYLKIKLEGIR